MALLQGQVSFEALEEARHGVEGVPSSEREKRLLEELIRLGFLTRETLDALMLQVEDLERFLAEVQAGAEVSNPEETPIQSATDVELITAADCPTTARALWVTMPNTSLAPDNRSILSVLKLPRWSHYVNLQFVGEGGMGRIFRAFDKFLKRPVALKFLRREDRSLVHRLFLEAQRQAQVDHPNICKVYEVAEWHGQAFVAMQFIEGDPLHRLSPRIGMMEKVKLMAVVADAVHAAHRQNLIHRDLKPANIMVEPAEEGEYKPYVLDFGLARDISATGETVEGAILGTYHYMSPEQARGDISQIDRRTDIYALGVTLYELLAGSPPFADSKGLDCLTRILSEDVPPLRKLVPEIPRDLETIVMKCLDVSANQVVHPKSGKL